MDETAKFQIFPPIGFLRCMFGVAVALMQIAYTGTVSAESTENERSGLHPIVPLTATLADMVQPSTQGDVLHDEHRIVDFRIDFSSDDGDWFPQLRDFYQLDWTLPATVTVDRHLLQNVGVRFKGASSYTLTPGTKKKSFDLDINAGFGTQRLYGYRKLNLNNGYIDPTMVREVLFQEISRRYVPAAKANLAKLSVNGTNWGVYTSVQQINRDFLEEWFPNGKGNLWRGMIKPFRSARPFAWVGEDEQLYETYYELRAERTDHAWTDLVEVIRLLSKLPEEDFASQFDQVFGVDNALWLIALENVFMDNDSFLRKGYDYYIFQEPVMFGK